MSHPRAVVRNASDAQQVKRGGETVARRRAREASELAEVASTVAGARVLWRVLESCGIHKLSYVRGDPYDTAFNEGARNIGNKWLAELFAADPTAYARMQRDAAGLDAQIPDAPATPSDPVIEEDDGN